MPAFLHPGCPMCVDEGHVPPRPLFLHGVCAAHYNRARVIASRRLTRFDVLASVGMALRAEDPRFDSALERWLGGAT